MRTVKEVESQLERQFDELLHQLNLLPPGFKCSVRLRAKARAKHRTAPFEARWAPGTDSIQISFESASEGTGLRPPFASARSAEADLADLIRALGRAESRAGYNFVSLKWFRDTVLPEEHFPSTAADSARRALLSQAIEQRLILTSKVPNPKSPEFPVTTIRLNRHMPQVRAILGDPAETITEFQPVPIRGENLSHTVLRDRR